MARKVMAHAADWHAMRGWQSKSLTYKMGYMSVSTQLPVQGSSRHRADQSISPGSVTIWIRQLKDGGGEAARQIWDRYFAKLTAVARARLTDAPKRVADEEDIALSIIDTLCRGAQHGRFGQLHDRDDLWRLLLVITRQKVVDQKRWHGRKKRGGDGFHRVHGLEQVIDHDPTPDLLVELEDQRQYLFDQLRDDSLRKIAAAKLEGWSNADIAASLGISARTVQRKVKLIHDHWSQSLVSDTVN
jgi:DNA-directed RNA polymerase specialized sigma24 family protein